MSGNPLWDGVREGCGTCEFWTLFDTTNGLGSCKRYPPTFIMTTRRNEYDIQYEMPEQVVPTMAPADWCGEYKRRGTCAQG